MRLAYHIFHSPVKALRLFRFLRVKRGALEDSRPMSNLKSAFIFHQTATLMAEIDNRRRK